MISDEIRKTINLATLQKYDFFRLFKNDRFGNVAIISKTIKVIVKITVELVQNKKKPF